MLVGGRSRAMTLVCRGEPSTTHTTVRGFPSVSPTSTEMVATAPVEGAQLTVIGSGHLMVGPVGLPLAIVWLQVLVLPQPRLVIVLRMEIIAVPQLSVAMGVSKFKLPTPHSLVLFPKQVMLGGVVSLTVTVNVQVLLLPAASVVFTVMVVVP